MPEEPSNPEVTTEDTVLPEEIVGSDRVAGRVTTEAERLLMAPMLTDLRKGIHTLRTSEFVVGMEPITHFNPLPPGSSLSDITDSIPSTVTQSTAPEPEFGGSIESLAFCTLTELSRLIRSRKVSSRELTEMYLARLRKFAPRLNCVVTLTETLAREQAACADAEIARGDYRGALHGIPYGLKDLFATRGIPTTYGASPYRNQIFDYDATVVERLEAAGAVLVAKLSMGELAMGDTWFGGLTRNPWKPDQGASGSSAGAGSATAAGLVGFSIGTETYGSIVSPCVVNGVTGLRPTYGRVSRFGAMALSWTMDKIGPMCRGVEDCALVFATIHGTDGKDSTVAADVPFGWNPTAPLSNLRVGIDSAAFELAQKDVASYPSYETAIQTLESLGLKLHPVTLPAQNPAYNALAEVVIDAEGAAAFAELAAQGGFNELVQQGEYNWPNILRSGATIPAADYVQALRVRRHLQIAMATMFRDQEIDAYVTVPRVGSSLVYTNLTGYPTVVTRCGLTPDGLPISIEFTAGLYREDIALRLAFAFEQATDWHRQWPDVENLPETPPTPAKTEEEKQAEIKQWLKPEAQTP